MYVVVYHCVSNLTFWHLFLVWFSFLLVSSYTYLWSQSVANCRTCTTVHCRLDGYRTFLILSCRCLTGWGVLLPDFFASSFFATVFGVLGCWKHKISFILKNDDRNNFDSKQTAECLGLRLLTRHHLNLGRGGGGTPTKRTWAAHWILATIISLYGSPFSQFLHYNSLKKKVKDAKSFRTTWITKWFIVPKKNQQIRVKKL